MNGNLKNQKIISFSHRDVVFLAISIHSISLEIDNYILELEWFSPDEKIRSNQIEPMMVNLINKKYIF